MKLSDIDIINFSANQLDLVVKAEQLLYEVYVLEQGWYPSEYNPSLMRIEDGVNSKRLTDKFQKDAVWFGVLRDGELLACHRVLFPYQNTLEVELYKKFPNYLVNSSKTVELNRLVVRNGIHPSILLLLLRYEFEWMFKQNIEIAYTTAKFPQPGNLFIKLGMEDSGVNNGLNLTPLAQKTTFEN